MKIAVFSGPTGGHFYPALAFSAAFKKNRPEAQILFVTGKRARPLVEKLKDSAPCGFLFLDDFPFPRPKGLDFIVKAFPFLLKLCRAFRESKRVLESYRPDLSVGFGSYIAFPAILGSHRRKIPTLIHEQNKKIGKANAWLTRFADRMALSFDKTGSLSTFPRKVVTGLPLRRALVEAAAQKGSFQGPSLSPHRIKILIVGGSQGAESLNRYWMDAIQRFSNEEKSKIAVIHITGVANFETIKTMYLSKEIEASVFPFYERMEDLYSQADLAITRAGASTLFELALFGIPAIVLPYPHADSHQEMNARYFEKEGALQALRDEEGVSRLLAEKVSELIRSPELRRRLSENILRLAKPQASEKLVEVAEELLAERKVCAR